MWLSIHIIRWRLGSRGLVSLDEVTPGNRDVKTCTWEEEDVTHQVEDLGDSSQHTSGNRDVNICTWEEEDITHQVEDLGESSQHTPGNIDVNVGSVLNKGAGQAQF